MDREHALDRGKRHAQALQPMDRLAPLTPEQTAYCQAYAAAYREAAYYIAQGAEAAYSNALLSEYGPDASNARYDRTRHSATPELAKLAAIRQTAIDNHRNAQR